MDIGWEKGSGENVVRHVADHLREADRRECWAYGLDDPMEGLTKSIATSDRTFTGYADSEPCVIFGVGRLSVLSSTGVPWLMGTDKVDENKIRFLRESMIVRDVLMEGYGNLRNIIHMENTNSLNWLQWMGFQLAPPIVWGPHFEWFVPFFLEKQHVFDGSRRRGGGSSGRDQRPLQHSRHSGHRHEHDGRDGSSQLPSRDSVNERTDLGEESPRRN